MHDQRAFEITKCAIRFQSAVGRMETEFADGQTASLADASSYWTDNRVTFSNVVDSINQFDTDIKNGFNSIYDAICNECKPGGALTAEVY